MRSVPRFAAGSKKIQRSYNSRDPRFSCHVCGWSRPIKWLAAYDGGRYLVCEFCFLEREHAHHARHLRQNGGGA